MSPTEVHVTRVYEALWDVLVRRSVHAKFALINQKKIL